MTKEERKKWEEQKECLKKLQEGKCGTCSKLLKGECQVPETIRKRHFML